MFKENLMPLKEKVKPKKEELSSLTIEEVFKKLHIKEPAENEIKDLPSYMKIQREVTLKLIEEFHDEQKALNFYQEQLAKKFNDKYRAKQQF